MTFRSILRTSLAVMILGLVSSSAALAEPDPEGWPAGPVDIEVLKHGADIGYAFVQAEAQLYLAANGENYVRVDYTVENRTSTTLKAHDWQFDFEGQRLAGTTVADVAKSGTRNFSKMIFGRRMLTAPTAWPGVIVISSGAQTGDCPDLARQKASCEQFVFRANAAGICDDWCQRAGQGPVGTMGECKLDTRAVCPSYITGCDCTNGNSDTTFDESRAMLDLLDGAPRFDSNPPRWEMRDIPLPR